jgi:hypothetical protein
MDRSLDLPELDDFYGRGKKVAAPRDAWCAVRCRFSGPLAEIIEGTTTLVYVNMSERDIKLGSVIISKISFRFHFIII